MHLLAAQAGSIQQEGEAIDLGQSPGDIVFASAADSELQLLAGAADRAGETGLRLASLLRLSHNLSVDLWLDRTVRHARLIVIRLLGGAAYWPYGVDQLTALASSPLPLAGEGGPQGRVREPLPRLILLPGEANPDPSLLARSTIAPQDWSRLHALFTAGGPDNADTILAAFRHLADRHESPLHLSLRGRGRCAASGEGALAKDATAAEGALTDLTPKPFPRFGLWYPGHGMLDADALRLTHAKRISTVTLPSTGRVGEGWTRAPTSEAKPADTLSPAGDRSRRPHIPILFYRAALEGAGTATLEALIAALEARNLAPIPILVSTLKEAPCIRFVQAAFAEFPPSAILNLTGFALGLDGLEDKLNPFAGCDAPVIQLIQSGRPESQWAADIQGLTSRDLAMQVVLPELDGRHGMILVGHKSDAVWHGATQCPLSAYAPDRAGIARAVDLAATWARLRLTPRADRRIGIVLANYPIRDGRLANGVGYDTPQSTVEILKALAEAGYSVSNTSEAAAPSPPSPLRGGDGGGGRPQAVRGPSAHRAKNITRARQLRNNATTPERVLWPVLREMKSLGVKFRRQVPIGPYVADFASHNPRLIVELDGETHGTDEAVARDEERSQFLIRAGYEVLRFTNGDVATSLDGIGQVLTDTIAGLTNETHPSPLRGGDWGGGPSTRLEQASYPLTGNALIEALQSGPTNANPRRDGGIPFALDRYRTLFATLPQAIRDAVTARWGDPEADPFVCQLPPSPLRGGDGGGGRPRRKATAEPHLAFHLPALAYGNITILLQPARGYDRDETAAYHDPDLVPPHAYLAAYLWLRHEFGAHALIHNGKHGSLEWLPGKATALDETSYPAALWGGLPHLYPFIVNDPGEGTQAKRRTGAVIIDHLVPPLTRAETYGPLKDLEALLDEYYAASGMDRRRLKDLSRRILAFARDARLDADIVLPADETQALKTLDTFLCDLKEAQIRDGLHILGRTPSGRLLTDLIVAIARVPRGEGPAEASLMRALADDLALGFDPLTVNLSDAWDGPVRDLPPFISRSSAVHGQGRITAIVEQLEDFAAALVEGGATAPGPASTAVVEGINRTIRPRLEASGPNEIKALLDGLDGKFIAPGPSGAPSRGRLDVLPTGRNFFSVDIRAVPTPTAWELGKKSAETLLVRHFQDHGIPLKSLVLSVWGTANMRTGGDDIAQALALIGARPVWDPGSLRVSGYEIIPLPRLARPRVDVTLRISGFFRDAFPAQIALFDRAIRAIGALNEPEDDNPIAARMRSDALGLIGEGASESDAFLKAGYRIFGSKPGAYGAGLQALIDSGTWSTKADLAEAVLNWGQYAYGATAAGVPERDRFVSRLKTIDAVVHNQDNREHDLLDSDDYYQFEGGLVATAEVLTGQRPAAWHNDHSRPDRPLTRSLDEEIARTVRSRVVNPKWIAGVMRHGYKGAFEIIATVDYMFAFAATAGAVKSHHFDLAFAAFIEDDAMRDFIKANNPYGLDELMKKFEESRTRGFWTPRSNSAHALLAKASP